MSDPGGTSGNGEALDLGDDIFASGTSGRSGGGTSGTGTARPRQEDPYWAIVLKTFSEEGHELAAETMVRELGQIDAGLARRARVHTKDSGSMVIVGQYDDREDPQAREELQRLRAMRINNAPVFSRVMLVHVTPEAPVGQLHPHDLRTVRLRLPEYDVLYTIDVAVWLDPAEWGDDQGAAEDVDIQRAAEAYASSLRAQGHEAYFYHDPGRGLSTVTVSVIGRGGIIDASVGMLHPEVEKIRKQFTPRLVNGEPLYHTRDVAEFSRNPDAAGLVAQVPQLVEIPK